MLLESYKTFEPANYLQEYYASVDMENRSLLSFFAEAYKGIDSNAIMLEFGGGPSLYSLITAASKVKEIHFSDFLKCNIEQVEQWKRFKQDSYLWTNFFREALAAEGVKSITVDDILNREDLLSQKLSNFLLCDAFQPQPLGPTYHHHYDVVAANFVAESITSSLKVWEQVVCNICSTLKPKGTLIMTAFQDTSFYCIEGRRYPAVTVTPENMFRVLSRLGFNTHNLIMQQIAAEVTDSTAKGYKGYKGMLFVKATRS